MLHFKKESPISSLPFRLINFCHMGDNLGAPRCSLRVFSKLHCIERAQNGDDWSIFPGIRPSHSSRCLFLSFSLPPRSNTPQLFLKWTVETKSPSVPKSDAPTAVSQENSQPNLCQRIYRDSNLRLDLPEAKTPAAAHNVLIWHVLLHEILICSQCKFFLTVWLQRSNSNLVFYSRCGSHRRKNTCSKNKETLHRCYVLTWFLCGILFD